MWSSRATCICDTLTWLPIKLSIPATSSNDLILRGIHDILHAIQNPSPASRLVPLTSDHYDARIRVTDLLTAVVTDTLLVPTPSTTDMPPQSPDPSLRVPTPPANPGLRVPAPPVAPALSMPLQTPEPPLRVESIAHVPPGTQSGPICTATLRPHRCHVHQLYRHYRQTSTQNQPPVPTRQTIKLPERSIPTNGAKSPRPPHHPGIPIAHAFPHTCASPSVYVTYPLPRAPSSWRPQAYKTSPCLISPSMAMPLIPTQANSPTIAS